MKTQRFLEFVTLTVCLWICFGGSHPPMQAQSQRVAVPVLTVEDAVQDSKLQELQTHQASIDDKLQKMWDAIGANTNSISGIQGEERGIGALLGALSIAQIILQISRRRRDVP